MNDSLPGKERENDLPGRERERERERDMVVMIDSRISSSGRACLVTTICKQRKKHGGKRRMVPGCFTGSIPSRLRFYLPCNLADTSDGSRRMRTASKRKGNQAKGERLDLGTSAIQCNSVV